MVMSTKMAAGFDVASNYKIDKRLTHSTTDALTAPALEMEMPLCQTQEPKLVKESKLFRRMRIRRIDSQTSDRENYTQYCL